MLQHSLPRRWQRRVSQHNPLTVTRLAIVALAFAIAFIGDVSTQQQWSSFWGSGAILISLWTLVPRLRAAAVPVLSYLGVWVLFNLGRALADNAGWSVAGRDLIPRWESRLFGGELPTIVAQNWLQDTSPARVIDPFLVLVHLSFFIIPTIVAVLLLRSDQKLFWRYLATLAGVFAIGVVGFLLAPTNPPWLAYPSVERTADRVLANWGLLLDGGNTSNGYTFEPNHVASMPSIHLATTAAIVFATWGLGRHWRIPSLTYLSLMGVALVYLGEHYLLDVIAGLIVTAAIWPCATHLIGREQRQTTTTLVATPDGAPPAAQPQSDRSVAPHHRSTQSP